MPIVSGMTNERDDAEVIVTEESACLYCGRRTLGAECEQCDAALESLKILSFAPIVKRPLADPIPSV